MMEKNQPEQLESAYRVSIQSGDWMQAEQIVNQLAGSVSPDIFDARSGIGQVPKNQDVDYFGFVKWMTPTEFRKIVPPGVANPATKDFLVEQLKKGAVKLGQPFLKAEWNAESKHWKTLGHEGRSRMDAIFAVYGDVPVPVHIFPYGELRARDLGMKHRQAAFVPEKGGARVSIQTSAIMVFRGESGEELVPLPERFPAAFRPETVDDLSEPPKPQENGPGPAC